MKKFYTLLPLLIFLSLIHQISYSQPTTLELTETLVIGQEQSNEPGYVLGTPDKIQVDSAGHIYVSDRSSHTIRVFNQNGEYQHSIGGRGRGPGEFLELTDFRLKQDGNLLALDRTQSKVSLFDGQGNVLREHSLPEYIEGSAIFIFPAASDGQYFLGYINLMQQEQNGHFLHLFDATFENKISEYYDLYETYFDGGNPLEASLSKSYHKYSTYFDVNRIVIIPLIYTGSIFTFDTENLSISKIGEPVKEAYEQLDWAQLESIRESTPPNIMRSLRSMSGVNGRFFIRMNASNLGLAGNQNFLFQFYGILEGQDIIPWANIYSADGSLIVNNNLSEQLSSLIGGENSYSFRPAHLDNNNKLYVIDTEYQGLYPAIRVFETNLGEFLEE